MSVCLVQQVVLLMRREMVRQVTGMELTDLKKMALMLKK